MGLNNLIILGRLRFSFQIQWNSEKGKSRWYLKLALFDWINLYIWLSLNERRLAHMEDWELLLSPIDPLLLV